MGNTIAARDSNYGIGVSPQAEWKDGPPSWGRDGSNPEVDMPHAIGLPPGPDNFYSSNLHRQMRLLQATADTLAGGQVAPGWVSQIDVVADQWVWCYSTTQTATTVDDPIGFGDLDGAWTPANLFAAGEQGGWWDPSDFSTMFQDDAGSVPVTAVEQTVGKILDKSGNGNHATQATAGSRPVLRQDGGGKYYLAFDGVDDSLATAAVDFTGTDKMSVFAGTTRLSVASLGMVVELSAAGSAGSFYLAVPYSAFQEIGFVVNGTGTSGYAADDLPQTATEIISATFDIAGAAIADEIKPRVNGAVPSLAVLAAGPAGTGNFGNHPLYLGRRGSTTLPFTGNIYAIVVRGAASTPEEITETENWISTKTPITF